MLETSAAPRRWRRMYVAGAVVVGAIAAWTLARGRTSLRPGFNAREIIFGGATHRFQVFLPARYSPARAWPVVLSLHGSGERGTDGAIQLRMGLGPYLRDHAVSFPAVVVLPQMPIGAAEGKATPATFQQADALAMAELDSTLAAIHADSSRIYLTGVSMGATRSWEILYRRPAFFAATVPIAGIVCGWCLTGDRSTTNSQADALIVRGIPPTPAWLFHGSLDRSALAANDDTLVPLLKSANWGVRYTEYAGAAHDVWTLAYQDPELWRWLFAQHR